MIVSCSTDVFVGTSSTTQRDAHWPPQLYNTIEWFPPILPSYYPPFAHSKHVEQYCPPNEEKPTQSVQESTKFILNMRIETEVKCFQVANYNIHPTPCVIFNGPLPTPDKIDANLYASASGIEIKTGFI